MLLVKLFKVDGNNNEIVPLAPFHMLVLLQILMCLYVCFVLASSMSKPKHTKLGSISSIMQIMNERQSIGTFNSSPLGQLQLCNANQPPNTPPSLPKFCDEVESPMKT